MTRTIGIIPSRYGSTRFPGKSLTDIAGKSMVRRVYEQASKALDEVWVATDDKRIYDHVMEFGRAIMTSSDHPSGTDRCREAISKIEGDWDYVINIQGDEPFIDPGEIGRLASALEEANGDIQIATLVVPIKDKDKIKDPNVVKVVRNLKGFAMYFSRSPIPFDRNDEPDYLQHIGIYAYRADILESISELRPSQLEKCESLEQLRWLENGFEIKALVGDHPGMGIDTPEDLKYVLENKLWQTS